MKGMLYCPRCIEAGRKPKLLAKYEDVRGSGDLYLWCKACKREVHIRVGSISVDR